MLTGYKATLLLPNGRSLLSELINHVRDSDRFLDPIVIGPTKIFSDLVDCEVVNTEGNLPITLETIARFITSRFAPDQKIAFLTSDILPTAQEIRDVFDNCYLPNSASLFWGLLVQAKINELGASNWKPVYHFKLDQESALTSLYPGHFIITCYGALRMNLLNRLLSVAYRFRNLELRKRPIRLFLGSLSALVCEDLRQLLKFKAPLVTITILFHGIRGYLQYRIGKSSVLDFSFHLGRMVLEKNFYQQANGMPLRFSVSKILSFAKDIDTQREFEELKARYGYI
jgi:hypothetical protein